MEKLLSEDAQTGISLLEDAEANPNDHKIFCQKFLGGLDYLLDYLDYEEDESRIAYIENIITAHKKNSLADFQVFR